MEKDFETKQENNVAGAKLVKGTMVLVVAGIIAKIFGAIFRIPLTNLIGAEGQSYYSMSYNIYSWLLVLSTAGFPVAISRMVSERIATGDFKNAHKTYKVSKKLMLAIGIVSFVICLFFARNIADFVKNPEAKYSIMALSPALLLAPLASAYRGYFQGQQNMIPTGASEVCEQLFRVIIGLSLSFLMIGYGAEYASAGATFGASAGLVFSFIFLTIVYGRDKKAKYDLIHNPNIKEESTKKLLKELVDIAIPITIGSSIMPLMFNIDAAIVMRRLQATGWTVAQSKQLYGLIGGYCDPLTGLPNVFIDAIAISMIPAVTAALTLKKKDELNKNIETGIKIMMLVAYPCAIGLMVLANPILNMLYGAHPDEADMATLTLQIEAVAIIALSMMRVFSSALQGIGKMVLPVINLAIGLVVKITCSYALVGVHALNVNGTALGTVLTFVVVSILNYLGLKKYADVKLNMTMVFISPLVSSIVMGGFAWGSYKLFLMISGSNTLSTLVAVLIAALVYFVLIFRTKTITREDAGLIPKGDKIFEIAEKIHLIKD